MDRVTQSILDAVNVVVAKKVEGLRATYYFEGVILAQNGDGSYEVRSRENIYTAKARSGTAYDAGDIVLVCVPNGDLKLKFIDSKTSAAMSVQGFGGVCRVPSYEILPAGGNANLIYVVDSTRCLYCWNADALRYEPYGAVLSVNGKAGAVSLSSTDIPEGANAYFTEARATQSFQANIAKTASAALADGGELLRDGDTLVLNCGNP